LESRSEVGFRVRTLGAREVAEDTVAGLDDLDDYVSVRAMSGHMAFRMVTRYTVTASTHVRPPGTSREKKASDNPQVASLMARAHPAENDRGQADFIGKKMVRRELQH
jgi:hypothetical protein